MAAVVAQVRCPQADTAVSAVVARVEQAQQLAMVLAAVVAQQVEQVQQRSMTTSEVQQALLVPLQMHLPTSIGAAAAWCASSSVVHATPTASASPASCQWGTPVVVAQVEQVQQLSMTTSGVQQALLVPLQMHLPTSIGAAATSCASSVVHVTSTASASSASCQWGTPAVGVARVEQVQRLSMTTSEVQQALLVPTHEMHPPIDHHLLWSLRCKYCSDMIGSLFT